MDERFTLSVTRIDCIEETDEVGSDEPYVVVFAADLSQPSSSITDAIFAIPTARTTLYGPWGDVDKGESRTTAPVIEGPAPGFLVQRTPFWGASGNPAPIPAARDALILIALLEHDEGSPSSVRAAAHLATSAALLVISEEYIKGEMSRPELGAQVASDFKNILGFPVTAGFGVEIVFPGVGLFPNGDDLVGVVELRLDDSQLDALRGSGGASTAAVRINGDGGSYRVHVEIRRSDGTTAQASSGLDASDSLLTRPAISSRRPGTLDVFGRGEDRRFYLSSWDGRRWSPWSPLGAGTFQSGPAAGVLRRRGQPEEPYAVGLGDDRRLYESRWRDGEWGSWSPIGDGRFDAGPAIVGTRNPRLFATGLDRRIYCAAWTGSAWSPFAPIGVGTFRSAPSAVLWGRGRLDVFAVGDDRGLYRATAERQTGGWSGWRRLGEGTFRSAPVAVSMAPNRLDVFAVGDDRRLYQAVRTGDGWSPWSPQDERATFRSAPAALSAGRNRLDLVAVGDDRRLYHASWLGDRWSGWIADTPEGVFR